MTDGENLGYPIDERVYEAFKDEYDHDDREIQFQTELAIRSWITKLDDVDADSDTPTHLCETNRRKKKTAPEDKTQVWVRVRPRTKERFEQYVDLAGLDGYGEGLELAFREHVTDPVFPELARPGDAEFDVTENRDPIDDGDTAEAESPVGALPDVVNVCGNEVPVRETFDDAVEQEGVGAKVRENAARLVNHLVDTETFFLSRNDLREFCVELEIGRGEGPPSDPTIRQYTEIVKAALELSPHPVYTNTEKYGEYGQEMAVLSTKLHDDPARVSVWDRKIAPGPVIDTFVRGFEEEKEQAKQTEVTSYDSEALFKRPDASRGGVPADD